jgi:tRNA dimethylallyltransferase
VTRRGSGEGAQPRARPVLALFGATALGKSAVADRLAYRLGAAVVVADSMQVYRGLAIVTNQPALCAPPRRYLVGFVSPQAEFSVADYAREAHRVIDGLRREGLAVIVEGGSGLYLRAALGGLAFSETPDPGLRRSLEQRWTSDPEGVLAELRARDPQTYARVDVANPRRVVRALESVLVRGGPLPVDAAGHLWRAGERYPHALVALDPGEDRATLRERIDARVDEMLTRGALEEVRAARQAGPFSRTVEQAIGVRELCAVLDGELSMDAAATRMKARTRALARRQLTWMRKLPEAALVPAAGRPADEVAAAVLALLPPDA